MFEPLPPVGFDGSANIPSLVPGSIASLGIDLDVGEDMPADAIAITVLDGKGEGADVIVDRRALLTALGIESVHVREPRSGDYCWFSPTPGYEYEVNHYRCDEYADGTCTDSRTGSVLHEAPEGARKGFR